MNKMFRLLQILVVISLLALPLVGCAKPLTLSLIDPRDGYTFTEATITVKGTLSDAKARVWVNDSIVEVSKKGFFSTEVTLTEGENTIKVVTARGEEVVSTTVIVTYAPSE